MPSAIDICSKLMFMGYSQEPFGVKACQQCISLSWCRNNGALNTTSKKLSGLNKNAYLSCSWVCGSLGVWLYPMCAAPAHRWAGWWLARARASLGFSRRTDVQVKLYRHISTSARVMSTHILLVKGSLRVKPTSRGREAY